MRRTILKIYGYIFAIGVPYLIWVLVTGIKIPCISYLTTGMQCPGCGITRMFAAMAQLRFTTAFSLNPVMFILFFIWNAIALMAFWGKIPLFRSNRFLYIMLTITVAILVIFTVIRNIP